MSVKVISPFSQDGVQCFPKLFIISAPAGAGKTTLTHMLQREFPDAFEKTVSSTTRSARTGEVHGVDYLFVSEDDFKQSLDREDFLEWVFLFGTYYGTSKAEISRVLQKGKHCIAVIDVQGALALKKQMPAVTIFIQAPSQEELERRLNARDSEKDFQKKERLEHSAVEIAAASEFDYVVINDDLITAYQVLRSIFIAEEHRMSHG